MNEQEMVGRAQAALEQNGIEDRVEAAAIILPPSRIFLIASLVMIRRERSTSLKCQRGVRTAEARYSKRLSLCRMRLDCCAP